MMAMFRMSFIPATVYPLHLPCPPHQIKLKTYEYTQLTKEFQGGADARLQSARARAREEMMRIRENRR
jgi:hypothetical protein